MAIRKKTVLVVGANGFLGSHVTLTLKREGYDVYGSIRPGKSLPYLDPSRVVYMDISHVDNVEFPIQFDAVVHCAAATSETTTEEIYSRAVNVLGTQNLIRLCRDYGVPKIVFISSMSAMKENPSFYAQTKLEAERVVEESGMSWVILRPGLIISDNAGGIFKKMEDLVAKFPVVPCIGNNKNLATIAIGDLCKVISLCVEDEGVRNETIDACADEQLSLKDIVHFIARRNHKKRICVPFPYSAAMVLARVSKLLGKPIITPDNVYGLKFARRPDCQRLRSVLSFQPQGIHQAITLEQQD